MDFKHISVMLNTTIEMLDIKKDGVYVDCTLGGGGHSSAILAALSEKGRLIGLDQDQEALKAAEKHLKDYSNVTLIHSNFKNLKAVLEDLGIEEVDGILYDLGVSSYQLDNGERGFSYMKDAPLDMRMNQNNDKTAATIVNEYEEKDLLRILYTYGEEKFAKSIVKHILQARPIHTTGQLVDIIEKSIPKSKREKGSHVAKRTFQALRIETNDELGIIEKSLTEGVDFLKSGGRMAVITFHSLEDRIAKQTFRKLSEDCICDKSIPICVCGHIGVINLVSKKPLLPSEEEIEQNKRSKSAKLRVVQKR